VAYIKSSRWKTFPILRLQPNAVSKIRDSIKGKNLLYFPSVAKKEISDCWKAGQAVQVFHVLQLLLFLSRSHSSAAFFPGTLKTVNLRPFLLSVGSKLVQFSQNKYIEIRKEQVLRNFPKSSEANFIAFFFGHKNKQNLPARLKNPCRFNLFFFCFHQNVGRSPSKDILSKAFCTAFIGTIIACLNFPALTDGKLRKGHPWRFLFKIFFFFLQRSRRLGWSLLGDIE